MADSTSLPQDTATNSVVLQDEHVKTTGIVDPDEGRICLNILQRTNTLSKLLPHLSHRVGTVPSNEQGLPTWLADDADPPPPLNVVIQIVGSRGDVQPFVALGKSLKGKYGHRVRLATHATFKGFVEENGLEFFNIGGDPTTLMEYMVKNPGLLPGKDSLKHGDVGKRKEEIRKITIGCWRSCIEAGDGMEDGEYSEEDAARWRPFVANAILANPPSFAFAHCAEKLGIPFHLMFTMPWSPTTAFPHPLANIQSTNTDPRVANFISYSLVQILMWQGLGPLINEFREEILGLEPCSIMWMPVLIATSKVPFTYCWSPALIPKPSDWGYQIEVAGFYFLPLASSFTPDPKLLEFLEAGPPPVYIGFGSITVEHPNAMTDLIFKATKQAGVRALISKGWGGLGGDDLDVPENVFMLGNVPHDWLFKYVSAVCHHGGAGTTAAGIAAGRPTIIVPFFGDQPFWGSMVHRAGAGPEPIPAKQLTAEKLAAAIAVCLKGETQAAAQRMAQQISQENGPEFGAKHFHAMLPLDRMRCACDSKSAAVWRLRHSDIRLGTLAAAVLLDKELIKIEDIKLNRTREYDLSDAPWDPVSGAVTALLGNLSDFVVGTASLPSNISKAVTQHKRSNRRPDKPDVTLPTDISKGVSQHRRSSSHPDEPDVPVSLTKTDSGSLRSLSRTSAGTHMKHFGGYVHDGGHVIKKDSEHLLKLPRELIQGLGKGFHNAPKLYHDRTVRTPDKVTNLKSGLRTAGKEFGLEMYDAVTGVISQPYHGAKDEGALGFLKGAGKGLGGLLLKPEAAILGGVGYAMEGVYKNHKVRARERREHHEGSGLTIQERVAVSWLLAGQAAFSTTTNEEKDRIVVRWHEIQAADQAANAAQPAHKPHRTDSGISTKATGPFKRHSRSGGGQDADKSRNSIDSASVASLEKASSPLSYGVQAADTENGEVEGNIVREDSVGKVAVNSDAIKEDASEEEATKAKLVNEDAVDGEPTKDAPVNEDNVNADAVKEDAVKEESTKKGPIKDEMATNETASHESAKHAANRTDAPRGEMVTGETMEDTSINADVVKEGAVQEEATKAQPVKDESATNGTARGETATEETTNEDLVNADAVKEDAVRNDNANHYIAKYDMTKDKMFDIDASAIGDAITEEGAFGINDMPKEVTTGKAEEAKEATAKEGAVRKENSFSIEDSKTDDTGSKKDSDNKGVLGVVAADASPSHTRVNGIEETSSSK